ADLAISIHCNSIGESSNPEDTKGTSVYYKHIFYKPLTGFIYKEMLDLKLAEFGQVGSFNFYLNSPTDIPSVLVETAFMSHPEDEMKLMDDDFRKEVAEKIINGVEEFLDYCDE
ncbi:MAG TPA: N-acetylmuramoyl-L-alanine amidase, partial [Ignavibacteriales bacterium]|nr:N-acetylmuramoyl-L-alanine amidase [Ignavibacteriales bacterium]